MNKKGFTLTELIVVMAIITILSSIIIGSSIGFINKAKKTKDEELVMSLNQIIINEEVEEENISINDLKLIFNSYDVTDLNLKQDNKVLVWNNTKNKVEIFDNNQLGNKESSSIEIDYINDIFILYESSMKYTFFSMPFIEDLYALRSTDKMVNTRYKENEIEFKMLVSYLNDVIFIDEAYRFRKYYTNKDYEIVNTKCKNSIILSSITEIKSNFLSNNNTLENIVFTNGLKTIHASAFSYCSNLKSIKFSNNCPLTEIKENAFKYCEVLNNFIFPKNLKIIRSGAFSNCHSIKSLYIPENLNVFGEEAFKCTNALSEINVSSDNKAFTSIDGVLYSKDKKSLHKYPCAKINDTYESIDELEVIKPYAFSYCKYLLYLKTKNLKRIENNAFQYCSLLKEVELNDEINKIGEYAFASCSELTSINFPNLLVNIEKGTFQYCHQLTLVVFNEGLINIGEKAFYYCRRLLRVVVPDTVFNIKKDSFKSSSVVRLYLYCDELLEGYEIILESSQRIYFFDDWNHNIINPYPY